MKQWSIEKKVFIGFLLAIVLLLGMGAMSYHTFSSYMSVTNDMLKTQHLLSEISDVVALNNKTESSHRAYLITEDDFYLRLRNQSMQKALAILKNVHQNETHLDFTEEYEQFSRLATERFRLLDEVLALFVNEGYTAMRQRLLQHPGAEHMSTFEIAITDFAKRERERLEQQAEILRDQSKQVLASFLVLLVLAILFLFVLYRQIKTAMVQRLSAERHAEARTKALIDSEERVRAIVETAPDAIITISEHGLIDSFNPAAERLFGLSEADAKGRNIAEFMPSPHREHHDEYIRQYLKTGEHKIIGIGREVLAQDWRGNAIPVELAVGEMWVSGKRMFAGMIRDVTERKQAQAKQEQLLKEVSVANDELKNFAYVVSHDLKAPLRAIGSLADWIATDNADKFDADGQENMRLLVGRVRRMDRLIDGILEYSRVGRLQEVKSDIDLNALTHEVVQLLAPPPNIKIVVGALPHIYAEKTRIHQLFQNLIGNAIQHLDKPIGEVQVDCVPLQNMWRFSVADNGPGIHERHFGRIFQLFQTLKSKDKEESTGIGLSLVKKIVEMYGGTVWLKSKHGEGTTFYFTLPIQGVENNIQATP